MERARLTALLAVLTAAAFGFALFEAFETSVARNPRNEWTAVLMLAFSSLGLAGWWLARGGRVRTAVLLVVGGLLALGVGLSVLEPASEPVIVLVPVLAVAIALPYVERRDLAAVLVLAWCSAVAISVLAELVPPDVTSPTWSDVSQRVGGVGVSLALAALLVWQFQARLRETLAALRRRETAARAARARYRDLFETMPVGLFEATPDGRLLHANPALARALGAGTPSTLVGVRPTWLSGQLLDELRSGEIRGREVEARLDDGRTAWLRLSLRSTEVGGRRGVLIEGAAEDITDWRATQDRLLAAMKLESVGRLAGGVAHDFNNLLTAIRGYADLLDGELEPGDERREQVRQIRRAADRASVLTAQLLAIGRRQLLQPQDVDLNTLLTEIEPTLLRLVGSDVQLVMRRTPGVAQVRADPAQLERVVVNLAINARDAMPDGGQLVLSTAELDLDADDDDVPAGAWVALTVADTGVGMDDETRSRAFKPFYTTKAFGKGSGLGLASVYGVVAQSGGHLRLDTQPGHGTRFQIFLSRLEDGAATPALAQPTLPSTVVAPAASPPLPRPASVAASSLGSAGSTILLVEDDRQLRDLMERVLTGEGFTVVTASRGDEALRRAGEHHDDIDLLVTDVVMPGLDGPGVARALNKRRPGVRTLFISGYPEGAIAEHGLLGVAGEFLQKPYSPDTLLARVRQLLAADRAA